MKTGLKQIPARYVRSRWLPVAIFLVVLVLLSVTALLQGGVTAVLSNFLFLLAGLAFCGVFCAAIWNFARKHWTTGIVNLLMLPVCGLAAFIATSLLIFSAIFGPGEDGFAENLTIPPDMDVVEPLGGVEAAPGEKRDAYQQCLLAALSSSGNDDSTIRADAAVVMELHRVSPEVLKRFLATSPAWRLFREDDHLFATRRWMIGPKWRYRLHGYYTGHDIGNGSMPSIPNFQCRFTLGFSGKPWARARRHATRMNAGEARALEISKGNRMHESHCIITGEPLVEVFEQSGTRERRLTKAALSHVAGEFRPLVDEPNWRTIRRILPVDSVRRGEPEFHLWSSSQPGLYDSEIWVNPGEPGMLYLKAFEATRGTPLSPRRLKERSNEWVGWSDNVGELFLSNTHFTIYEGDWGTPYAARFEAWFTPDSGAPERKIMEKVFKIEGWQR